MRVFEYMKFFCFFIIKPDLLTVYTHTKIYDICYLINHERDRA